MRRLHQDVHTRHPARTPPPCPPVQVTKGANGRSERGSYLFFDTATWDVLTKLDVEISFDDVELPTRLPRKKWARLGAAFDLLARSH